MTGDGLTNPADGTRSRMDIDHAGEQRVIEIDKGCIIYILHCCLYP